MNSALLVIDMLNDFVKEDGALYIGENAAATIEATAKALEKVRQRGWPVIYICDQHLKDDAEFRLFQPHCVKGTKGAAIIDELQPQKEELIIPKRRYSAFYGTELDLFLRERKIEELLVCGVCTNICVLYTTADARMRNYEVKIVKEAVASFDSQAHQFALKEMENTLGAKIVGIDQL